MIAASLSSSRNSRIRPGSLKNRRTGALFASLFLGLLVAAAPVDARIGQLNVPNGDFSDPANEDSISGGVLGTTVTRELGNGPWSARSAGASVALLSVARPTVSIDDGSASVSGLLSVNAALVTLSNSASFFNHDIGETFVAGRTYTLDVQIRTESLLNVGALNSSGTGVALLADGDEVAASSDDNVVSLRLLNNRTAIVTVTYDATAADEGKAVGISLYTGRGGGLLEIDALGTISFENVALSMSQTFGEWAELNIEDETQRGLYDNPSGDGIPNLLKYALNLDPNASQRHKLPAPTLQSVGPNQYLSLDIARDVNAFGAELVVEVSEDLVNWVSGPEYTTVMVDEPLRLLVRDNVPVTGADRRFIRLSVNPVD